MFQIDRRRFLGSAIVTGAALAGTAPANAIEPIQRTGKSNLKLSIAAYSYRKYLDLKIKPKPPMTIDEFADACVAMGLDAIEPTSYALSLAVHPGEELSVEFGYDPALFDVATVERLAGSLRVLLAEMADNPDRAVFDLSVLPPAERAGHCHPAGDGCVVAGATGRRHAARHRDRDRAQQ